MVGKIAKVHIREVFKSEPRDFTTWMEENIDVLNEQLGLSLSCSGREQPVGDFNVDLVAEDSDGNRVVIENQLEKSNHDHLGKIITYLSNLDAKSAIWIVTEPRNEHIQAINWLNERPANSFYLIKLEGLKIGNSEPAPLFTLIVGPSEENREVGNIKQEEVERYVKRKEFWQLLQNKLEGKTRLHSNLTPTKDNWWSAPSGKPGMRLNYLILKDRWAVELYIDKGKGSEEENKKLFEKLLQGKPEIDEVFGKSLDWQQMEGRQACRIRYMSEEGGLRDYEKWSEIQSHMIDAMIKLDQALKPYIAKL